MGYGFAWLPEEHISKELQTGILKPVTLEGRLYARSTSLPNSGKSWLCRARGKTAGGYSNGV